MKNTSPTVLQKLSRYRLPVNYALVALTAFWQITLPLQAAQFYWDADGNAASNDAATGLNLGGAGTWDTTSNLWWDLAAVGTWPSTGNHTAIFTGAYPTLGIPVTNAVTLTSGTTANQIQFLRSGYALSGGDLTLSGPAPTLHANLGESASIGSNILGSDGLTKTGGGSIRLSGGSFTGVTTIANGTLIISNPAALGSDPSAISILTNNNTPLNTNQLGFGGGSLVLDGSTGGFTFTRDINFEGRGPIGDRGSAIQSIGDNTLSGILNAATSPLPLSPTATFRNSRINSVNGALTLSGTLNSAGAAATTFVALGGVNSAGVGDFTLSGILTGSGSVEKSGAGVLYWNPSSTSGFTGTIRVSGSSTGQQSSVQVTQLTAGGVNILGGNTGTNASAAIDMNGGVLEFRNEGDLNFNSFAGGKNVYLRANSTFYTGPAVGGEGINKLTTLGTYRVAANTTGTFNSRNGYSMTLGTWTQESSNNNNTMNNNLGGLLTFTGDVWNNNDGTARTLSFGGNGNTRINGSVNAAASPAHVLAKSGSGLLTIAGVGSTYTGSTNISGGAIQITDFRSINNNTAAISLGNASTTAGNLIIGGTGVNPTAAGLTTSKTITLNTTSASNSIYANQAGTNPVILNGAINKRSDATTGSLILGGTNNADNIINSVIPVETTPSTGGVVKLGPGTWVLNAANTYAGPTTIQNGTLKLRATGAASDVIKSASSNTIVFSGNGTTGTAGGVLEFRGFSGAVTTENLGALTLTAGPATVRLLGNGGSAANLVFTSLAATTAASSLNFETTGASGGTVTLTGQSATTATNLPGTSNLQGHIYINGADFATINGSAQVVAPSYGSSGNFQNALTALAGSVHNKLIGSFSSGAATVSSLVTNSQSLTLGGNLTVSTGAFLQSGGTATILSDSTVDPRLILGGAAGTNIVFRVNTVSDVLNIGSATNLVNIGSAQTGGLTKNGAGKLVFFGTNAQTGTTNINEGTIELNGTAARLAALAGTNTVIRQNASLDFNTDIAFAAEPVVGTLDGAGTIRNTGSANVTLTQTGAGTWVGSFNETGSGKLSVSKLGTTGAPVWNGISNYTGVTTIGGTTGSVTVNTLADGGLPSSIGASSNDASNLVFAGTTAGLIYTGNIFEGALTLGSRSATTDRLFTLAAAATGATISSNVSNNNAIIWSNTGPIVNQTTAAATLIFGGTSTGDNTFKPQLVDSSTPAALSITKNGAGQWNFGNSNNTYTGFTTINEGILALNDNGSLPSGSALVLAPTSATSPAILQMSGVFERNLTTTPTVGSGDLNFGGTVASTTGGVGFAAHTLPLVVAIGGVGSPTALTWGSGGFVGTGAVQNLVLNSTTALSSVDFRNSIDLGATARTINVLDNGNTGADYATMSGVLSGTNGIIKIGSGILRLSGANSYAGTTAVEGGTIVASTLGSSTGATTSSIGASGVAMDNTNAIVLGNATTTGGILQYVGPGEISDRKIRIRGTTASNQIHADGSGPLILTNVAHDTTETGDKTLFLRGSNADGNMITSQLSNNAAGVLSVTIDGGATWILTNSSNNYTGTTSVTGGALGIANNTAIPAALTISNGNVFAYGGDRTLTNTVNLGNNATSGFIGDYNLTFNGTNNLAAGANNLNVYSSIVPGKSVTFNGLVANSLTGTRALAIDGPGEIVINGNFTTSTGFGVNINKNGNGILTLGTNGATSNWNQSGNPLDVDRGTLKFTANNAIPSPYGAATTATSSTVPVATTTYTVASTAGLVAGQVFTGTNVPAGSRILSIDSPTTFTASLAPTTQVASGVTLSFVASGGVVLSPELATTDTATMDLNGTSQTITSLTGTTDGTIIIDNTSSSPASLTFGANNSTVNFGTGTGTYTITDSGTGALSIYKAGNTTTTIPTGVTLSYQGVTGVTGGTMSIASPLNGTSGLSVVNSGSTLNLTGGITNPAAVTSIEVTDGGTLNLTDGAGSQFSNLATLTLGSTGGSMTTLGLNVGDASTPGDELNTDLLSLLSAGTLNLFAGNKITLNLTDAGLNPGQTYDLLTFAPGGFTSGPLTSADWLLGATPGGFTGITLTVNNDRIFITTGTLITGSSYWNGTSNTTWNVGASNWSQDKAGSTAALSIPGQGTDVIFQSDAATSGAVVTTLEQNFKINSLTFEPSTIGANTPASIAINPGTVATNRLEIAPQNSTQGISILAGGTPSVTISAPFRLGANQTWNVADAGSVLTLSGGLQGEKDVTKTGAGKVILSAAADSAFNAGVTTDFTINGGTLEVTNLGALGTTVIGNLANLAINTTGAFFYNNTTSGTIANPISLAGGTLSAGGNNQTYSGAISISANSFINMADSNTVQTGAARNITLSGPFTGTGDLTIDSNNTVSNGNQLGGTLTINNALSSWASDLYINRGTVTIGALASPTVTPDDMTFNSFGRFIVQGVDGQTINRAGTLNLGAGAVGEFQVDNTTGTQATDYTINQNGNVTLGTGGSGATLRVALPDAFAKMNIAGNVLMGGNSSISLSNAASRLLTISGVISDGGSGYGLAVNDDAGAWAQTNGIVRLTGLNTFTGNFSQGEGTVEFDTVTDISGGASSLGNGSAISIVAGVLSFIGNTSQTTNRPITITGSSTLNTAGTGGAEISYTGAINLAGNQLTLTGASLSNVGNLSGGITQSGTSADLLVNSGTWNLTGTNVFADDVIVTGANAVLNLNAANTLSFTAGTSNGLYIRTGATVNLNASDVTGAAAAGGTDFIIIADNSTGGGTLNLNSFNITTPRFDLGQTTAGWTGSVIGSGTLTVTADFNLYEGSISANLAGAGPVEKFGSGTVILSGDNSGLTSGTGVRVDAGELILDYTSSNTVKLREATGLDMRGGSLTITGSDSLATAQSVNGLTLTNGSNRITVNPGSGQTAVLNLGGITRAAGAGSLRVILPLGTQDATFGVTTTAALNTYGTLGGFLTVTDASGTFFATKSGNNIVPVVPTVASDISTWTTGQNITDTGSAYTGTTGLRSINSLSFNNALGGGIAIGNTDSLDLFNGGILLTSNLTGGTPSISGGRLTSSVADVIVTHDGSAALSISSQIGLNNAVTKTGNGILSLNNAINNYTGATQIQAGVLRVAGGNAIGNASSVVLSDERASTLELLANETIGNLSGGNAGTGNVFGTVALGSNTLTINTTASATYAGIFTGAGSIVRNGTSGVGNLLFTGNSGAGFTGAIILNGGLTYVEGAATMNASSLTLNKGSSFLISNNGTTRSGTRFLDTMPITLNSADGAWNGETRPSGLAIRTDQAAATNESVGILTLASGASYFRGDASGTTGAAGLITTDILRTNNATINARGRGLGGGSGDRNFLRIASASTAETLFVSTLVGGSGAAGSKNISIIPWGMGEVTTAGLADANMGNSLLTYSTVTGSAGGFRPLDLTTEYSTFTTKLTNTDNIRESLAADLTGLAGQTINALVINNSNTGASTVNVAGTGAGQTLAITSGTMLFTSTGAVTGTPAMGINLSGFDDGISVGSTNEYVFFVQNPTSAAAGGLLTATVGSPLVSTADITKSGRGTLILTGINNAGGNTRRTTLNEGILEISDLDNIGGNTGSLVFAGGTLRLGTTLTDDISSRTITFLNAGGIIDTNSVNLALANSVGSGVGGLTKVGLGTLTLGATASYTGPTSVNAGTLAVTANNATGIGGALTVGAGATLDIGTSSINHSTVTTTGASPVILGTGTINSTGGFNFTNTGDITVNAVLAGSVGLFKNQTNILTLNGLNTYTGSTEIQNGTVAAAVIANAGTASSLGAPTAGTDASVIRMGLTTAATGLSYIGTTAASTNRIIAMQGTTGGVTLNGNGTGTGSIDYTSGAAGYSTGSKTLTLSGTSDATIVNRINGVADGIGVITLAKSGTNLWEVYGSSSYTGQTQINEGTLQLGNDNALPLTTTVRLGTGTTAGVFDLNGFDQSIGSLLVQTNSNTVTNSIVVDASKTLTVNGTVTIGANAAAGATTLFTATGGGSFVNNNDGGTFQVGGATGATNTNNATADFSGLSNFTVNVGSAGTFRVGDNNTNSSGSPASGSTLILASTASSISAGTLNLGQGTGQGNAVQTLSLGAGTNTINADTINIGGNTTRSGGTLNFAGATGSVQIRAFDGVSPVVVNMVNGGITTGIANNTAFLLAGHESDVLISTMTMAAKSTSTGATSSVFTFDQGTLDITTLDMVRSTGSYAGTATASVTIGGGTAAIDTVNMALNSSTGAATSMATLNITGGDVTIGTGSGTAINMANASASRTSTSTLSLTGGSVEVLGSISRTGGAGTENATITLDGASLDMNSNSIGATGSAITFNALSGTLAGLSELNGGAALTKTSAGVLIMGAANAYTGPTNVSDGVMQVGVGGVGTTGTGLVSVVKASATYANASVISGSGSIQGALVVGDIANAANRGILSPGDGDHAANNATLTISAAGGLTIAAGSQTRLGVTSATGIDAAFAASGLTASAYLASLSSTSDSVVGTAPSAWFAQPTGGSVDFLNLTNLAGTLTLGTNGGTAAAGEGIVSIFANGLSLASLAPGQIFNMVDWYGAFSGGFNAGSTYSTGGVNGDFDLPDISITGYSWDTSAFTTHGVLAISAYIIPEPSRALLLMLGLALLMIRRRRND